MTYTVDLQNLDQEQIPSARLIQAAETVLAQQGCADGTTMSVVISTNEAVQALNAQHRGIDAPTDVLSFPADPLPPEIAGDEPYAGDIIIAYDYAVEQAQREGHTVEDSLCLLVVHGTLHILGYDHDTPDNRAKMWAEQAKALQALGIDESIVPALEGRDDA